MVASACLSLAAMHLVIWFQRRTKLASLFCELWLMPAPAEAGREYIDLLQLLQFTTH
jgi:hypothetical protein